MYSLPIRFFAYLVFSLIVMTVMISIHMMGLGNFQSYLLSGYARISRTVIDQNNNKANRIDARDADNYDHKLSKKIFNPKLHPNIYKNIIKHSRNDYGQNQSEYFERFEFSPVAKTAMVFSSPQGLHVNLQLHIEIQSNKTDFKSDIGMNTCVYVYIYIYLCV
jgi:hypothetical protein